MRAILLLLFLGAFFAIGTTSSLNIRLNDSKSNLSHAEVQGTHKNEKNKGPVDTDYFQRLKENKDKSTGYVSRFSLWNLLNFFGKNRQNTTEHKNSASGNSGDENVKVSTQVFQQDESAGIKDDHDGLTKVVNSEKEPENAETTDSFEKQNNMDGNSEIKNNSTEVEKEIKNDGNSEKRNVNENQDESMVDDKSEDEKSLDEGGIPNKSPPFGKSQELWRFNNKTSEQENLEGKIRNETQLGDTAEGVSDKKGTTESDSQKEKPDVTENIKDGNDPNQDNPDETDNAVIITNEETFNQNVKDSLLENSNASQTITSDTETKVGISCGETITKFIIPDSTKYDETAEKQCRDYCPSLAVTIPEFECLYVNTKSWISTSFSGSDYKCKLVEMGTDKDYTPNTDCASFCKTVKQTSAFGNFTCGTLEKACSTGFSFSTTSCNHCVFTEVAIFMQNNRTCLN